MGWSSVGVVFQACGLSWRWSLIRFSTTWRWCVIKFFTLLQKGSEARWTLTHRRVCWQPVCLRRHGEPSHDTLASVPPSAATAHPPTSLPPADTDRHATCQALNMKDNTTPPTSLPPADKDRHGTCQALNMKVGWACVCACMCIFVSFVFP